LHSHHAGLDAHRLARIDEHLERNYIGPGKIAGCQVAISRRGRPAYFKSFGLMDRERNKPVAADTIFRIYSMTKPITSVALMQLWERGYFQLNDPVSRFVPEWKQHRVWVEGGGADMKTEAPQRPVSMRDMLMHTGGLTYGGALAVLGVPDDPHPVELAYKEEGVRRQDESLPDFLRKLGGVPLRYQPGERWMYSLSTDVCGALVEVISGQRFDHYLQEHIFGPLGMTDTAFHVPDSKLSRFAANYRRAADKSLKVMDDPETSAYRREPGFLSGGGGLVGTTADYMRFCEALAAGGELDGKRILGPRTIELMGRNHLKGGADLSSMAMDTFSETANDGVGFGLGFATVLDTVAAGTPGAGDMYWGGAASTIFWVDPKEQLSVVFMTQLIPSGTFNFRGQLKNLVYSAITD
jgi:CubicO group peptidase (beta-lactamase class C family)